MATTREILEETVTAMEEFADQVGTKQRLSDADRERLDGYSDKVNGLVAKIKRDNGERSPQTRPWRSRWPSSSR